MFKAWLFVLASATPSAFEVLGIFVYFNEYSVLPSDQRTGLFLVGFELKCLNVQGELIPYSLLPTLCFWGTLVSVALSSHMAAGTSTSSCTWGSDTKRERAILQPDLPGVKGAGFSSPDCLRVQAVTWLGPLLEETS